MNRDRINRMRTTLLAIVVASGLLVLALQPTLAGRHSSLGTSPEAASALGLGALGADPPSTTDDDEETPGPISAEEASELTTELHNACGAAVALPNLAGLTEDEAEVLVEPLIEACEAAAEPGAEPDSTEAAREAEADDEAEAEADEVEAVDDEQDAIDDDDEVDEGEEEDEEDENEEDDD